MKIAMITITIAIHLSAGFEMRSRMFSPRPSWVAMPMREAISWKMMVATVANRRHHSIV